MLSKKKFTEEITKIFAEELGVQFNLEKRDIKKNNGVIKKGLVFRDNSANVSPIIYFDDLYEEYKEGRSMWQIAAFTLDKIKKENKDLTLNYHKFMQYDQVKDKISVQLINYEKNKDLLENIPHKKFLDLEVTFRIIIGVDEGNLISTQVTNSLFETWGVSVDEMAEYAVENGSKLLPEKFTSLEAILYNEENPKEYEDILPSIYLLTNIYGINGASTVLYPGVLRQISDQLGADLIVLPSSVHEVLLLKYSKDMDIHMLENMVRDINSKEVKEQEVLSNRVYRFNRKNNYLEFASDNMTTIAA